MRASSGAQDVKRIVDVGNPITHGLVQGVFEGSRAALDGHHLGAQQLHTIDVQRLALDVFGAHVHHAFQAQARRHGGTGHAVLAGTGFGNHPRLAAVLGQERLADGVVNLVRAGVVEVFALEPDLGAADFSGPTFGVIQGAGSPNKVL